MNDDPKKKSEKPRSTFLDGLPPDLQREFALEQRIGVREYAEILDLSIDQTRRSWRKGLIPAPTRIGGRKLGVTRRVAMETAARRSVA